MALWATRESRRDLGAGLKPGCHITPDFRVCIDSVIELPRLLNHQLINATPKMRVGIFAPPKWEAGGCFQEGTFGKPGPGTRGVCLQACKVCGAREGQCISMNLQQAAHHGDTQGSIFDVNLGRFVQ